MKRLTKKEKEFIIKSIIGNKSLAHISNITKRGKPTIYYYYKKIKGKKYKSPCLEKLDDEFIGEFLGIFAGDGNFFFYKKQYRYLIRLFFNVTEIDYVNELAELFYKNFRKKPNVRRENGKNHFTIEYISKDIYCFIKKYLDWVTTEEIKKSHSIHLKEKEVSKEFKIGFVRGLFDSDGHISRKRINFASTSIKLTENAINFLRDLGIEDFIFRSYQDKRGKRKRIYHIDIRTPGKGKFIETIKPRNRFHLSKCVNFKRKVENQ